MRPTQGDPARLAEIFSSQVRAGVLTQFFLHKELPQSLTQLARHLGLAISSVQHEVYKLERLGILTGRRDGASRRYRLNLSDPFTLALEALVLASVDQETVLRAVLADTPGLIWATVARNAEENVTLVLVGDIDLGGLAAAQLRIAEILHLPPSRVSPSFYTPDVWLRHLAEGHPLVQRLAKLESLAVFGAIV